MRRIAGTPETDRLLRGLTIVLSAGFLLAWCAGSPTESKPITGPPPPECSSAGSQAANAFFRERFDDRCLSQRGWYDNTNVEFSASEHAPGSTNSVQFHFAQGATTPSNGAAMRHKFPASSSMYLSYLVKYSPNWIGSGHTYHPHQFYALSTMDGDYDGLSNDWMTLYVEDNYQNGGVPRMAFQDNKAINSALGLLPLNLITVTPNRSAGGCNGVVELNVVTECYNGPPWYNDLQVRGPVEFQPDPGPGYKGNWNFVEAFFQLNSIVDGVEKTDGVMQYWFNGTLIIDRHDILFRTAPRASLQWNQLVIAPYIGDGSPADQTFWIDDVTVAASRSAAAQMRTRQP
jgi:hypothetical protein